MDLPIKTLSPSGASTYESCPRKWYYRYVEHIKDPAGEPQLIGTFVHLVFENLFGYDYDPSDRTIANAKLLSTKLWEDFAAQSDFKSLGLDEERTLKFKQTCWKSISGLWQTEQPTDVDVYALELEVSVDISGVPFYGFIDRIERTEDGHVVTDYKSGKWPKPQYEEDKMTQLYLYAEAMKHFAKMDVAKVKMLFPGEGTIERDITNDRLEPVVKKFRKTWNAINKACETETFVPVTGPLCGWCPHIASCPEGQATVVKIYGKRRDNRPPALEIIANLPPDNAPRELANGIKPKGDGAAAVAAKAALDTLF